MIWRLTKADAKIWMIENLLGKRQHYGYRPRSPVAQTQAVGRGAGLIDLTRGVHLNKSFHAASKRVPMMQYI
ncbi:hypothetical protein Q4S45_21515 [Massilia sp. R2A-15]|uniref:hypothetical protein n=1 Tax=Massilia sp. R2A-15 TaxID=3064278 RepID=UPI0027377539|nr:hypothetical protein [Massilia sp. R2A-15]WLI89243.1 hypothetical protein Q4S45_21515 [Massilia sp. R2A-15]